MSDEYVISAVIHGTGDALPEITVEADSADEACRYAEANSLDLFGESVIEVVSCEPLFAGGS